MTISTHERPRCRAHRSNGDPCSAFPIHGGSVCVVHGGKAPQVKKAAEERIRELVDPALNRIARIIETSDTDSAGLAAARDILDRAGYAAKQQVEITLRQQAVALALQLGLDADDLIAEAERIASAG